MKADWGMSWDEYKELDYFCRQYERKKAEAEALLTLRISTPQPVTAKNGEGVFVGHGKGAVASPVEAAVDKREKYLHDIAIIETAARMAGEELYKPLLFAVTRKKGMTKALMKGCPCSQTAFYAMRRRFFFILKQLRENP